MEPPKIEILSTKKLPLLNEEAVVKLRKAIEERLEIEEQLAIVDDLGVFGRWLNLYETSYRKDGKISKWGLASRRRGDNNESVSTTTPNAVVTVPILVTPEGERKLVLIKEFRVPIETYEYHFTAGLKEKDESIENCVRRELKEEAGFDLLKICRISPIMPSSAGMTDETSVMAFAECTYGDGKQQLEHSEDITVILLNHAEVCEWAKRDVMYAAKTWPVMLMFEQMGSLEMK